jgi:hypothetical protein
MHGLVVLHEQRGDEALHLGRDHRDVAAHIGIVRVFDVATHRPPVVEQRDGGGQHYGCAHNEREALRHPRAQGACRLQVGNDIDGFGTHDTLPESCSAAWPS